MNDDGFRSRKFIVTMSCIAATIGLAYFKSMNSDAALVLGACVAAYNWANAKVSVGK